MTESMLTNTTDQHNEELNFTTFIDLCRFCSIKNGPAKIHLFDKEAEQRNLLFKIRSLLPINVCMNNFFFFF